MSITFDRRLRRKRKAARAFNSVHTHTALYDRGQWMCPTCNAVHKSDDFCFFNGRLFPACCEFERGSRNDREHCADPMGNGPLLVLLHLLSWLPFGAHAFVAPPQGNVHYWVSECDRCARGPYEWRGLDREFELLRQGRLFSTETAARFAR